MAQSRTLLDRLIEALGARKIRRFFPDPADAEDERGNETRLSEFISLSLEWMAKQHRIRLTSSVTIPANGVLVLDSTVKKVSMVEQGGEYFHEASIERDEYFRSLYRGSWKMHRSSKRLFCFSLLQSQTQPFNPYGIPLEITARIKEGAATLHYAGVPTESDLTDESSKMAAVNYAQSVALRHVLTAITKGEFRQGKGVLSVRDDTGAMEKQIKELEASAKSLLRASDVVMM